MAKHLVIVGAGFGGLKLARCLNNHPYFAITLIDRNNYHQFQPLLYQVATAGLDASNISFPLRHIFQNSRNVTLRIAEVSSVNTEQNFIETSTGILEFDYLVIATGADTHYFGNEGMLRNTFPMKSTLEALELRNRLIQNYEEASLLTNPSEIKKLLTLVVVGAGPTGVELSGALAEMKQGKLPHEYPRLDPREMTIYLLEGGEKVLGNMSEVSSRRSREYLEKMGVTVRTNTRVKEYDGERLTLEDGSILHSSLVIWAAGIQGNMPSGIPSENVAPGNRIRVNRLNQVLGIDHVFALGDVAFMPLDDYPKGLPQVANVAIDQAANLADNLLRFEKGKPGLDYSYHNKGAMATVGRNRAVVDLARPKLSFQGFVAWMLWMGLHLILLMGFKNRIIVFVNWVYHYFTRNQSLSLWYPNLVRKPKK